MNDFVRSNKLSSVYWLKESVDNLGINIKLRPPDDIISLPKYEDYRNETSNICLEHNVEEFSFKWQEKSFSECELQRYKDVHNCLTENELKYHELIKSKEIVPQKVFSYIHEDYYIPLPQEKKRKVNLPSSCLEYFSLEDAFGRLGNAFGGFSASERHLFKSQEDVCEEDEQWTAMHVVFDNSDYNEDTVLLKQEANLVSLYHNTAQNYIIITPDVNNLETNPYIVETNAGEMLGYQYEVDVKFGETESGEELITSLTKLYKKWEKKHKHLVNFVMPPLGKVQFHVTIDLISATRFDMDNLYVEYVIKHPESVRCNDTLHGRTHVSESASTDKHAIWNFGHLMEFTMEMDTGIEPPSLNVYFEAISTDFWHRHRTEGYAHLSLPLSPGVHTQELRCVRPDETRGAEERRFFIGGCHLIKDLEVLSRPELQNGDYTFTETGTILLRTSVIVQSSLRTIPELAVHYETSTASALLLGAEAALRKYKRARARLAQATTRPD